MTTRHYPTSCLSAFCGRAGDCTGCKNLPVLEEFKAWKERTQAVCLDEVWSPTLFKATIPDPATPPEPPTLLYPARIVKYLPGHKPRLEQDNSTHPGQAYAQKLLVKDFGFLLATTPAPFQIPLEDFIARVRGYSSNEKTEALCALAEGSASAEALNEFHRRMP